MPKILFCGSLYDGIHNEPIKNSWITINNGAIESVQTSQPAVPGEILDLSKFTVLPGFIDSHDHVCLDPGDEIAQANEPLAWLAIRGAARVKKIIEAGVTTVRNAGEHERIDLSLKRAINAGLIPGPYLVTAGVWICRTGGHGWIDEREADGEWELRKAIREQVKFGTDWIKIMVTGGLSTPNSDPMMSDYTREEIFSAVDEAHRLGKKIAAHAHGGRGVDFLIEAGVDSIEHGFYLTKEQLKEMAKKRIYLCSTYGIIKAIIDEPSSPEYSRQGCIKVQANIFDVLTNAIQENVPVVVGTDGNHGKLAVELEALIKSGYNASQALKSITSQAANLLGMTDQIGSIEAGYKADLVAIEGDPFNDIYAIENIKMVIREGKVLLQRP